MSVGTNIPAIPTVYNGVHFRSRLEARWAAFFDLLGWKWDYEPVDLHRYVPDFVLHFKEPLLVEVKPVLQWAEFPTYSPRIESSGWEGEALILGAAMLGWFGEDAKFWGAEREGHIWGQWQIFHCLRCGKASLCSGNGGSWRCRVTGCYDGDAHMDTYRERDLEVRWRQAQNTVQWKRPPGVVW